MANKKEEQRELERQEEIKVIAWNIAGIINKDEEFWEYLKEFDIIGLSETWLEETQWRKLEPNLPVEYKWKCQLAKRENKKGRARGGIITGVKRNMQEIDSSNQVDIEGVQERNIRMGRKEWKFLTVYNNQRLEEVTNTINNIMAETEGKEVGVVISGDFNARIGEVEVLGADMEEEFWKKTTRRKSKDKVNNKEGRKLVEWINGNELNILNGRYEGDEEGEYTYTGYRGATVIDYALVNKYAEEEIREFRIEDRVESDHQPLTITLKIKEDMVKEEGDTKRKNKTVWLQKNVKDYRTRIEHRVRTKEINNVDELVEEIKNSMEYATGSNITYKLGKNRWWNRECRIRKMDTRRALRKWKKRKDTLENYLRVKEEYKKYCEDKKKEWKGKEEKEIANISKEKEVWKYVNKERKNRTQRSAAITGKQWKSHFMKLLEGDEKRKWTEVKTWKTQSEEITREEVDRQIGKLKKQKATGVDEIPNEAWKFITENGKDKLTALLNKIWKEGKIPSNWRKAEIFPIFKAGNRDNPKNYRGISLLNTSYKIYAMILTERLQEEIEEKNILTEGQAGFRANKGTIDNIYVLNYLIEKEIIKEQGKAYAFFVDLKAAFDGINRKKLFQTMRTLKISETIIIRIEEIYAETINVINEKGENFQFWTGKGLRQGCPLSPTLFNVYVADLEAHLAREQIGGITLGRMKIRSLAYADDVVLIANKAEDLKALIRKLEKYLEKKELALNPEKSKIMEFRKGGGRKKKEEWKWKGEDIEVVQQYKYLGYYMQSNNGPEVHWQYMRKKSKIAIGQLWSIVTRKFNNSFKIKMMLFDAIIRSMVMYAAEIWGWQSNEGIEALQTTYIKWILQLDKTTPNYMVQAEVHRFPLAIEAGRRAMRFEQKAKNADEGTYIHEVYKEINKDRTGRTPRSLTKWERVRKQFYENAGFSLIEISKMSEEGARVEPKVTERKKDIVLQERRSKIEQHERHRIISIPKETPKYLQETNKHGKHQLIARFRCGNEERALRRWMPKEHQKCRICRREEETLGHLLYNCAGTYAANQKHQPTLYGVMHEDGRGESWMREVKEKMKEAGSKM